MLVWYGRSRRRHTLIVLLLLLFGSLTAIRFGLRETVESQPPDVELRFRMPNGEIETISSRWPLEYQMPTVDPPEGKVFVNWYLDAELTTRFETNITPLSHRTFFPRFDSIRQELRFIDTYGIVYGRILGDVGSAFNLPAPPQYYGLTFVGYDTELPDSIPLESMLIQALYKPLTQIITLQVGDTEIEIEFGFNQPITTELIQATLDPVDGQDLIGFDVFFEDEETFVPLNEPVPIPEGAIVTPVYEDSTYRIRFFGEGISLRSLSRVMDELIGRLPVPQLDGFQFNGWFEDEAFTSMFDLVLMPARNINLFAKWISVPLALTDEEVSAPAPEATPTPTPEPTLTPPPPSNDDPVVTTYLYEFIDSGVVIASGMLEQGDTLPDVTPPARSGFRFDGWDPVPTTMPNNDIQFIAQYTELYMLTIVYNDPDNTVEVIEMAPNEPLPLDTLQEDTTSMYQVSSEVDNSTMQPITLMSSTSSFIPLTLPTPAIEVFIKDATLKDAELIVNSQTTMPEADLIIYARWNFKVEVEIVDPVETDEVLGSGLFYPGQLLTPDDFPTINPTDALGYQSMTWSGVNPTAPRIGPGSPPTSQVPVAPRVSFTYRFHLNGGEVGNVTGTLTEFFDRGDLVTMPIPTRAGFNFVGWFKNSGLTGSVVGNYTINRNNLASRSSTDVDYYAKWEALPAQEFTLQFFDENNLIISSGKFLGGSDLQSVNVAVPNVPQDFAGQWRYSGVQTYGIPETMPYANLDLIPYYELTSYRVELLIQDAIAANTFSGLQILSGQTDTQVVQAKLLELTSGFGGHPSNITLNATRVGNLNSSGTNTYTVSLVSAIGQTLTMTILVEFSYSDEFVLETTTQEVSTVLEVGTTSGGTPLSDGISETSGLTSSQISGFQFANQNSNVIECNLTQIKNEIIFLISFGGQGGVQVSIVAVNDPSNTNRSQRFDISITRNQQTSIITRFIYWGTGGTLTYPVCTANWKP
jgi:uncharacterized repeat protein (TIGR02543 family)